MFQKTDKNTTSPSVNVANLIKNIKSGKINFSIASNLFNEGKLSAYDFGRIAMECESIISKNATCHLSSEIIKKSLEFS